VRNGSPKAASHTGGETDMDMFAKLFGIRSVPAEIASTIRCSIILLTVFAAAIPMPLSTALGQSGENDKTYKSAVERYFNAYMKADLDTLLDSLDPAGPMYPKPAAIAQLRATAAGNAVPGEAAVKQLTVVEPNNQKAIVKMTMVIRADLNRTGNYQTETSHPTCELRSNGGKWRIFNCSTK
jgi:hypothetical protein